MEKIILRVEGMSCGHCEIAVQDAIRKLPGVRKAKASKKKKEALVEFDPGAVTREQIENAVSETGYSVVG
jgi:copper chaperone